MNKSITLYGVCKFPGGGQRGGVEYFSTVFAYEIFLRHRNDKGNNLTSVITTNMIHTRDCIRRITGMLFFFLCDIYIFTTRGIWFRKYSKRARKFVVRPKIFPSRIYYKSR